MTEKTTEETTEETNEQNLEGFHLYNSYYDADRMNCALTGLKTMGVETKVVKDCLYVKQSKIVTK